MDLFLFEKIAVTRLEQRRVADGSPGVRLRMPDGRGDVRLATHEWEALGDWFRDQLTPSAKRLRLAIWLSLPLAVALTGISFQLPAVAAFVEYLYREYRAPFLLALTGALPLTMATLHALAVRRAIQGVNRALAERPRLGTTFLQVPRALNAVELIALVLVGPHLVLGIIGSLNPDAFRNTPWTGTHLGPAGIAGLAVLLALGLLRWRRMRQGAAYAAEGSRSVDVVARAREP